MDGKGFVSIFTLGGPFGFILMSWSGSRWMIRRQNLEEVRVVEGSLWECRFHRDMDQRMPRFWTGWMGRSENYFLHATLKNKQGHSSRKAPVFVVICSCYSSILQAQLFFFSLNHGLDVFIIPSPKNPPKIIFQTESLHFSQPADHL